MSRVPVPGMVGAEPHRESSQLPPLSTAFSKANFQPSRLDKSELLQLLVRLLYFYHHHQPFLPDLLSSFRWFRSTSSIGPACSSCSSEGSSLGLVLSRGGCDGGVAVGRVQLLLPRVQLPAWCPAPFHTPSRTALKSEPLSTVRGEPAVLSTKTEAYCPA